MAFRNRRVILPPDVEDRRLEARRKKRAAEIAKMSNRPAGATASAGGNREAKLTRVLEKLQPPRSTIKQLGLRDIVYITQILGQILIDENPVENEAKKKNMAGMYVKLLDIVNHLTTINLPKPADSTMGPMETDRRTFPTKLTRERAKRMTKEEIRKYNLKRREALRRDPTKYPTGYPVGMRR